MVLVCCAQEPVDKIFSKDGTTLSAKVLEVLPTEIKYKKASNPGGPTYTVLKSDVIKIVYANGEVELMAAAVTKSTEPKEEIRFGATNFLTFSDDGRHIITDLTTADKNTYLCYWGFDMKLKSRFIYENRQIDEGLYNWQIISDDGCHLHASAIYNKNRKLVTRFVDPITKEPFDLKEDIAVISPDGKRVLFKSLKELNPPYGYGTEYVFLFDSLGNLLTTQKLKMRYGGVTNMRFSHSSNRYFILWFDIVMIFDADGNKVSEFQMESPWVHRKEMYNAAGQFNSKTFMNFSFDDQYIIAPDNDEQVTIWDMQGNRVRSFQHDVASLATISRNGKWVATAGSLPYGKTVKRKRSNGSSEVVSGGKLKIWAFDGTLVRDIPFPVNLSSLEFTPDNAGLVGVVEEVPVWLWAEENYSLPEGMDKGLNQIAMDLAAQSEADRKADNARRWGLVLDGFVTGVPKALNNMSMETAKADKQRKRINDIANSGQKGSAGKEKGLKIAIDNKTTKSVESVYISPREDPHWSNDILGKDVLLNGEEVTLIIPSDYGKGCSFDMKVVYPDGKTAVWENLDFCKYYTFQLFSNGRVVFSAD